MPDKRKHRGKHPGDDQIFNPASIVLLKEALKDLNYLLEKGYNQSSALTLVGNRYKLTARQRLALSHSSCSEKEKALRKAKMIEAPAEIEKILIDGYNVIITLESALSGAYLFKGSDGCIRDLSGLHGNYRKIEETEEAIKLCGYFLHKVSVKKVVWYLDSPVSNSGRLKTFILDIARENNWEWEVLLDYNPDKKLIDQPLPVASNDSFILNNCTVWINLISEILNSTKVEFNIIDLTG